MSTETPDPTPEDRQDTYADLTARLAAADIGWSHEHGDPPAEPDYIKRLAFQVMAFQPPLVAGVYVDDATLNRMRDRLHGDRCGCGEWDSHSGEYIDQMDATIHAVLYPLRHQVRSVPQVREDGAKRLAAVRKLYLEWTGSTNPVLLAAAGRLREAAGFVLTDQEREQIQGRQR